MTRNLFMLGRRAGSEDQLTEMLAYLWERRPELIDVWLSELPGLEDVGPGLQLQTQVSEAGVGRFDLTLERPGDAFVVVESKIDAELTSEQLGRYMAHLSGRGERMRALVSLTRHPPPPSPDLLARAREAGVVFVQARWQHLARAIADPYEEGEAGDFVRMLIEEGIVVPQVITDTDLDAWNRGAEVLSRIKALLTEARPVIQATWPQLRASSRWGSDDRWIYSGYTSGDLELGVGFSANESAKRPTSAPVAWVYLRNPRIPSGEAPAKLAAAMRAVPGATQVWPGFLSLHQPAHEVLRADDFDAQVASVVGFAVEVVARFQEVGYLPGDLARDVSSHS